MRCFCRWSIEVTNIGVEVAVNLYEIGRTDSLARQTVIWRAIYRNDRIVSLEMDVRPLDFGFLVVRVGLLSILG